LVVERVPVEGDPLGHTPVLTRAVCELLAARPGDTVVDATVGAGGHARLLAKSLGGGPARGCLIGLDVDPVNLELARKRLADCPCRVELLHANFAELGAALETVGVSQVDVLFADLGVSSTQLDDAERGFSFRRDGPLDMRMDPRLRVRAADLVNRLKERELGEPASRKIARRICEVRREGRITRTGQLADIVAQAVRVDPDARPGRIHPATRVFLALRMAVNDEPAALVTLLEAAPAVLGPGGRFGVIAFHSVEDKPVKLDFRRRRKEKVYELLTTRPVVAEEAERRDNPRSRSAKLRVAVRLPVND
jgi:16S rRNA (cytosine1402-N4)-methyltransferase